MDADELGVKQGQIRASIGPLLETRQCERKAYVYREQFPTRGDKARRAQSINSARSSFNVLTLGVRKKLLCRKSDAVGEHHQRLLIGKISLISPNPNYLRVFACLQR